MKGYYFITDSSLSRSGAASDVRNALKAKVELVQYRDKAKFTLELYKEAFKLRKICKSALFIVNDRVDIALAVDADGVHIGQDDLTYAPTRKLLGRKRIIGVTVHALKEAQAAQAQGADYVAVSPIFATSTKPDAGPAAGLMLLKIIRRQVKLPIVAIGGITLLNAPAVIDAGADMVCAISAVVTKKDVLGQIKKFQQLF